jgi:hypothetical protein
MTKCPKCGGDLVICPPDEPWNDEYACCEDCNSTFIL